MHIKKTLLFFLILFSLNSWSQKSLDTIKVYNVHCTYTSDNSINGWGGNYTSYYPSVKCPDVDKEKYISNQKIVDEYMDNQKFFWIKLYDINDQLQFEGLKYSDCCIGPFICYWPNGKIKLKGQYNGYTFSEKKGYKIKECSGKETGTWEYFDENGKLTNKLNY